MRGIRAALAQIAPAEKRVLSKQEELRTLRVQQQQARNTLESDRKRRGVLLASLNKRVAVQSRELERLREDEARLAKLLTEIDKAFTDVPLPSDLKGAFGTLRGKLALPARGRVIARYGQPKGVGTLRWRGLFLAGEEGQPVQAVARGRVAYADWLRGFGLLLILEHGDGYMSLYGHNQSLHKQVGEWVEARDTVGRLGTTGDAPQPGVYFEIRHHGQPRDPTLWVKAR
jgi:septal ring factor EnvC (AmiA/AmiB activator)